MDGGVYNVLKKQDDLISSLSIGVGILGKKRPWRYSRAPGYSYASLQHWTEESIACRCVSAVVCVA